MQRETNRTRFLSFSGIDGAGKSTQIEALCTRFEQMGLRVRVIRFWDDVAQLTAIREGAGHKIFGGDKGVGAPEAPIERRDKNVQSWPMSCVRLVLYFLDALSARRVAARASRSTADVVIFDRYIYDELANLKLRNPLLRTYARMLIALAPRLQISYLLDADPAQARARKPEYPLDFLYANRQSYLDLNVFFERMTLIAPMPIEDAKREVWEQAIEKLAFDPVQERGSEPAKLAGPYSRPAAP
jgi:thymidylate kinase